mgnify:CR=1 FL=1
MIGQEKNDEWREEEWARIERCEEAGALSKEQADARKAVIDDQAKLREKELEQQKKEIQEFNNEWYFQNES